MTNCCVKCYTSVGCSVCYIVISVWAIIMLGILAILFGVHKRGDLGELKNTDEENCKTLWINVIIYFIICVLSAISLAYRLKHPFEEEQEKGEDDEIEEFITNGAAPEPSNEK